MARPIVMTGVIDGKTITLDDETWLPKGYRITMHLILQPTEALELTAGAWSALTAEDIADYEQFMSKEDGIPCKVPEDTEPGIASHGIQLL